MVSRIKSITALALLLASGLSASAQAPATQAPAPATPPLLGPGAPLPPGQTSDPFKQTIVRDQGVISVRIRDFATLPDIDNIAARQMSMVEEPGTRRLFVSEMRGVLYSITPDGRTVTPYVDTREAKWGHAVQSVGRERGLQSFAFHPQFARRGTPGYGKFYTYTDTTNQTPAPDHTTPNTATANTPASTHDTVLLEWTARNAASPTYDGDAPRELLRLRQPFANHNGGMISFNGTARPGTAEAGLLYIGVGDGGSGGDPMNLAQNLGSPFGKILRINPLGRNSRNGKYGIPANNPFVSNSQALGEIYAYGVRNTQGFSWDSRDGAMYMSDIGQNIVEEVSPVTAGANLGWNVYEGSFKFVGRQAVMTDGQRADPRMVYPIVEWDQFDPTMLPNNSSASVGAVVYRSAAIPQLRGKLLFGDMPSGELFHVDMNNLPKGGVDAIRRVLFVTETGQAPRTLLSIVQDKNRAQGKTVAQRADMRFFVNAAGQVFLLNKADGVIRVLER